MELACRSLSSQTPISLLKIPTSECFQVLGRKRIDSICFSYFHIIFDMKTQETWFWLKYGLKTMHKFSLFINFGSSFLIPTSLNSQKGEWNRGRDTVSPAPQRLHHPFLIIRIYSGTGSLTIKAHFSIFLTSENY